MQTTPDSHAVRSSNPAAGKDLLLLVSGRAPRSQRARANLRLALADAGLEGLEVREVDVLMLPSVAVELRVFSTPALVCVHADGADGVLYGDLSKRDVVVRFLVQSCPEVEG